MFDRMEIRSSQKSLPIPLTILNWLVVWNSRGLNTFQLVRPSQLSVDGYVPRFRHGTDPGDLSGLGRCGLCFLP